MIPLNVTVLRGEGYETDTSKPTPLCEECLNQERLTPSKEVHHIVPLEKGGTHDEHNLMALCKACHSRITAEMGDRWHDR